MGSSEKYCLKWNDYRTTISSSFQELRDSCDFFDVTLATDEAEVQAHRVILSACSPQLRDLLKRHANSSRQNLLIYLRGVRHSDLEAILQFMYNGEVNVAQEDLNSFLAVAEDLKVKGLTQQNVSTEQSVIAEASKPSRSLTSTSKGSTNNGGAPPLKRVKREPSIGNDEIGVNQPLVVTPDVSFDTCSKVSGEDDEGMEDSYQYQGAFGGDAADLVSQAAIAVAGTSGTDGNKDFLDSPLINSWVGRGPDGRRMCKICGLTGGDVTRIKNHIESLHLPHSKGYSCEQCSAVCKTRHGLACHKSRHHPKNRNPVIVAPPIMPKAAPVVAPQVAQIPPENKPVVAEHSDGGPETTSQTKTEPETKRTSRQGTKRSYRK